MNLFDPNIVWITLTRHPRSEVICSDMLKLFETFLIFFVQFTSWVDAVIFVFSLENETSFNAIYNYYAKMAQYRNIQDVPLILVGTQGIRKFFNSFPVIVCLNPFSPVMFRLKTFLLSEDRFQYKGAAHSKLTRPACWYLKVFCLTQRSFKIVDSLKEIK